MADGCSVFLCSGVRNRWVLVVGLSVCAVGEVRGVSWEWCFWGAGFDK
jgi:hypothetical protein